MIKKKIWLIDDDPIYMIIMKKNIAKTALFLPPRAFSNGLEALECLEELVTNNHWDNLPNIILLDIEMPILDGWGFMDKIEKHSDLIQKQTISIYISSSSIAFSDKEKAIENPLIVDFMSKPISLENLILIGNL